MPTEKIYKIRTAKSNLFLRVARGHFATSHSHINYYIDVSKHKARLSEAKAVASELAVYYKGKFNVDTILCLDGTQVIGTCLAEELSKALYSSEGTDRTINIVTPEHTAGSQLLFRDNYIPMISGCNVLILAASVTTGFTARAAVEAIRYYGGTIAGISAIFSLDDECCGYPVRSVFDVKDLTGYVSYASHECPMCKNGDKIDALVNSFGYSKL